MRKEGKDEGFVRFADTDSIYRGIYTVFRDRTDFVDRSSFTVAVKEAIEADDSLRKELESELTRLEMIDDERCYISMVRKKFLRRLLHGEERKG